jgi:hypothetical protein
MKKTAIKNTVKNVLFSLNKFFFWGGGKNAVKNVFCVSNKQKLGRLRENSAQKKCFFEKK